MVGSIYVGYPLTMELRITCGPPVPALVLGHEERKKINEKNDRIHWPLDFMRVIDLRRGAKGLKPS